MASVASKHSEHGAQISGWGGGVFMAGSNAVLPPTDTLTSMCV